MNLTIQLAVTLALGETDARDNGKDSWHLLAERVVDLLRFTCRHRRVHILYGVPSYYYHYRTSVCHQHHVRSQAAVASKLDASFCIGSEESQKNTRAYVLPEVHALMLTGPCRWALKRPIRAVVLMCH